MNSNLLMNKNLVFKDGVIHIYTMGAGGTGLFTVTLLFTTDS